MGHPLRLADFEVALLRSDAILALLLLAGLVAGLVLLASTRRPSAMLVLAQLAAIAGFYTYYRATSPYYYYPAVALAAVLMGASLFPSGQRRTVWTMAATALAAVFLAYGGVRGVTGAWALTGWSWLHDQLVAAVVAGRPPRALFYQSGSIEVYYEAALVWEHVHGLRVMTGVLEPTEEWKAPPSLPGVAMRDLQPGDWILEQFGARHNSSLPLRDLNVTRSTEHALMGPSGNSLLPIRLLHQYEARFRYPTRPFNLLPRRAGFLQWRVYEVTDRPRITLEGHGARGHARGPARDSRPGDAAVLSVRPCASRQALQQCTHGAPRRADPSPLPRGVPGDGGVQGEALACGSGSR
jgi:hypothetical protein